MEGYPKRTNIIEDSIYDTTHVHYISMVSEYLKWVIKEKECFNLYTGEVLKFILLRMKCTNKYNNKIGGVGIVDNSRNYYRIYFRVFLSSSRMHALSTYVFIACTLVQGKYILYRHGLEMQ